MEVGVWGLGYRVHLNILLCRDVLADRWKEAGGGGGGIRLVRCTIASSEESTGFPLASLSLLARTRRESRFLPPANWAFTAVVRAGAGRGSTSRAPRRYVGWNGKRSICLGCEQRTRGCGAGLLQRVLAGGLSPLPFYTVADLTVRSPKDVLPPASGRRTEASTSAYFGEHPPCAGDHSIDEKAVGRVVSRGDTPRGADAVK